MVSLWYLLAILFVSCMADVQTDLRYIRACNETSTISLDTLNNVLINKRLEGAQSSNFKCFLHCLFVKYGWMDEDGGFFIHEMKRVLDEAQLEITSLEFVLFKCTAIGSVDKCERSFLFTECFWKKAVQAPSGTDQYFYHTDAKE